MRLDRAGSRARPFCQIVRGIKHLHPAKKIPTDRLLEVEIPKVCQTLVESLTPREGRVER
jgi:hypothetical protein